jgi:hypothetical protein
MTIEHIKDFFNAIDQTIQLYEKLKPYIKTQYRSAAENLVQVIDRIYTAEHDLFKYPNEFKHMRLSQDKEDEFRAFAIKYEDFRKTPEHKHLGIRHGDIMMLYKSQLRRGLVDLLKKDKQLMTDANNVFDNLKDADEKLKDLVAHITDPLPDVIDKISENYTDAERLRREYLAKTNTQLKELEKQEKRLDELRQEFRELANF